MINGEQIGLGKLMSSIMAYDTDDSVHFAIWHLRMPRLLTSFFVGLLLSMVGYLLQTLTNNALADPYVMGTASGAALGANLSILGYVPVIVGGVYFASLWAFIGAILVTVAVIRLSFFNRTLSKTTMVLAGISISALASSVSSILIFYSDSSDKIRSLIFWSMGSFENSDWKTVSIMTMLAIGLIILTIVLRTHLGLHLLGIEQSRLLKGKHTSTPNWILFTTISFVVAFVVSEVGPVGFVGLIVPHIVRALGTKGVLNQIVLVALCGGCFMLICELVSKMLYPPVGLPIGVVTSTIGVPYFIYLLRRTNYRFY
jgi:iron complex transport system permease protein